MHKLITFLLVCFCLLGLTAISNHSAEPTHEITALKLKKSLVDYFEQGHVLQGIEVTKGVLRPSKDYEIVYDKKTKAYVVKPIAAEHIPDPYSGNFDIRDDEGDGMMSICTCNLEGEDDVCFFTSQAVGTDIHIRCNGLCSCYSFDFVFKPYVLSFETADGEWHF